MYVIIYVKVKFLCQNRGNVFVVFSGETVQSSNSGAPPIMYHGFFIYFMWYLFGTKKIDWYHMCGLITVALNVITKK